MGGNETFAALDRALLDGEAEGFVKVLVERGTVGIGISSVR
jgi:pyruvate/2-oxoglutarate dehydrogenase complex dihydrolipoamide dehydrogenase (E3) component